MVYIDPEDLGFLPFVKTWVKTMDETILQPDMKEFMLTLFDPYVENGLKFLKKHGDYAIHQVCSIIVILFQKFCHGFFTG